MRGQIRAATVTEQHVQTVTKGGKTYRYLRIPGQPRIRLPDLLPEDPAFLRAYADATRDAPVATRAKAGTISAVAETDLRSDRHKMFSDGYRRIILRHVDAIRNQADDALMRDLRAEHIQADLLALTPVQARDRTKARRLICLRALDLHLIPADPFEGVRCPVPLQHTGHPAWTREQGEAFRGSWPIGSPQRTVMELLH